MNIQTAIDSTPPEQAALADGDRPLVKDIPEVQTTLPTDKLFKGIISIPTYAHLHRAQHFLERHPTYSKRLGEKTYMYKKRGGEEIGYWPETAAIASEIALKDHDNVKVLKKDLQAIADKVFLSPTKDPASGTSDLTPVAAVEVPANPRDVVDKKDPLPNCEPPLETDKRESVRCESALGAPSVDQANAPANEASLQALACVRRRIPMGQIDIHAGTESRAINRKVVAEYVVALEHKTCFPPIIVFQDEDKYNLADGFHRFQAALTNGADEIEAEVFQGGRIDALKKSLGSNQTHGQRRTTADKRYAVDKALREFSEYSDNQIAALCGVSAPFAAKRRKKMSASNTNVYSLDGPEPQKRLGRDGKKRRMPKKPAKVEAKAPDPEPPRPSEQDGTPRDRDEVNQGNGHSKPNTDDTGITQPESGNAQTEVQAERRWHDFRDIMELEYGTLAYKFQPVFLANLSAWIADMYASARHFRDIPGI